MADMSLNNITVGKIQRPLKISLYGVDGVGKTSFGAGAPKPIFISTEDGTHHVDVARFPVPETWADLVGPQGAIAQLFNQDHDFQTVVVDSMDWAEALCDKYIVERYNAESNKDIEAITDIPFGKWKGLKMVHFTALLDCLSTLVRLKNMHIIAISHALIKRFDDPERDTYERYELKLFPELAAKVREWSDYNLFAQYDMTLHNVGEGFSQRPIGRSHGKRLLFSQRKAAYDAKARFSIQDRLDLSWDAFWSEHQRASAL